jgi:hypothetical protein
MVPEDVLSEAGAFLTKKFREIEGSGSCVSEKTSSRNYLIIGGRLLNPGLVKPETL